MWADDVGNWILNRDLFNWKLYQYRSVLLIYFAKPEQAPFYFQTKILQALLGSEKIFGMY